MAELCKITTQGLEFTDNEGRFDHAPIWFIYEPDYRFDNEALAHEMSAMPRFRTI